MQYYIPALVPKTTHVGNSLSSFNVSFSALDNNLFELSGFTHDINDNLLELSSFTVQEINDINETLTIAQSDILSLSSDLYPVLFSGTTAPDSSATFFINNGFLQSITLTGNTTIMEPEGDAITGQQLKLYINSGTGGYGISLDPEIIIPSESTFSSPYILLSANHIWITQIEYLGSNWALTTLVGGYNV